MMNQRILLWNTVRWWETQLFAPAGDSELESMVSPSLWQRELEIWASWRSEGTQMKWTAGMAVSQSLGSRQERQIKKHRLEPNTWSRCHGEKGENQVSDPDLQSKKCRPWEFCSPPQVSSDQNTTADTKELLFTDRTIILKFFWIKIFIYYYFSNLIVESFT